MRKTVLTLILALLMSSAASAQRMVEQMEIYDWLRFRDDVPAQFGTDGDYQIYFESPTGRLVIEDADGNELFGVSDDGATATLYVDGTQIDSGSLSDVHSIGMLNEDESVTGNWNFTSPGNVDYSTDVNFHYSVDIRTATGIDYSPPGGDVDTEIVTVGVTGTPRIYWEEAVDRFRFSKSVTVPNLAATGDAVVAGNATVSGTVQGEHLYSTDDAVVAGNATVSGTVQGEHLYSTDDGVIDGDLDVGGDLGTAYNRDINLGGWINMVKPVLNGHTGKYWRIYTDNTATPRFMLQRWPSVGGVSHDILILSNPGNADPGAMTLKGGYTFRVLNGSSAEIFAVDGSNGNLDTAGTITAGSADTVLTNADGTIRPAAIEDTIAGDGLTYTSGVLSVDDTSATKEYAVPLTELRVWDDMTSGLPGTPASDDLGCVTDTWGWGTDDVVVQSSDACDTSVIQYARFMVPVPALYDAGTDLTIDVTYTLSQLPGGIRTIDLEARTVGTPGTDICTTSVGTLVAPVGSQSFTLSDVNLDPGDVIDVRLKIHMVDTNNMGACVVDITDIRGSFDLKY
jgi:hypothetical protein